MGEKMREIATTSVANSHYFRCKLVLRLLKEGAISNPEAILSNT